MSAAAAAFRAFRKEKLQKLSADQGGRLTLEKGDDPKDLELLDQRQLLGAAAAASERNRLT